MKLYTAAAAAILAVSTTAYSQDNDNILDTTHYVQEVVVRHERTNTIIPAQRLSGAQLQGLQALSAADAIRYFSGVQIKDYGGVGGLKTIDLRSMGTNHTAVFYDGIAIGNAQNGQVDLGKFSMDNIEEISMYNGQKSSTLQSARDYASAGSIYLRTRKPHFHNNEHTNLSATLRAGSFGLWNPAIRYEQKISSNISAYLSGEYLYADGKYDFRYRKRLSNGMLAWDTTAVRHNGDIHSLRTEGAIFGTAASGTYSAKLYYYHSERGIPGAVVNNVWKRAQRQWDRNMFVQTSMKNLYLPASSQVEYQLNMKYARDYMRYLNPDTTLMLVDNDFVQQEYYATLSGKYSVAQWLDISASVDYLWNTLASNMRLFPVPRRNTLLAAAAISVIWNKWKLQASMLGTRAVDDTEGANYANTIVSPTHRTLHKLTPAVFAAYQPFAEHALHLRIFYKRIFRMPTFNDLYYTDIGNIKLKPEYATQYNVGVYYERKWTYITLNTKVDAYYNEVTDKIVAIPKGNSQYRWMMQNIGYVQVRGVDVSAQVGCMLLHGVILSAMLNYTYQRAQDYSSTINGGVNLWRGGQIAYIPWHSGSVILNSSWRAWMLNYSFVYVGERYTNSANIAENHVQPYYTHDMTFGYSRRIGKCQFKLNLQVNNILNQYYDVIINYPMPAGTTAGW